jgi:uroporphyrinogen-III decarboxylase
VTSRERVLTAFGHRTPDRVPAWCGASPAFWDAAKDELALDDEGLRLRMGDDFRRVSALYAGPDLGLSNGATWKSPFGIERTGIGYGQPLSHPLAHAASVKDILDYPWPDPDWMDVSHVKAEAEKYAGEYAILGGDWSPFWHDAIDFTGMDRLYFLMYDHPDAAEALFRKITDFYAEVSLRMFEAAGPAIDIFFIGNDFGSQTGPLLGPAQFDQFALPSLSRLIDLGHRFGKKVMLHCCGGFRPLLPSMIAAGLDAVHALQPSCEGMEPRALKRDFGSRIVLNGAIDSHHVLIMGTPDSVRAGTRAILDIMAPGGGYIAGASHDWILPETPLANVLAMFDTIREYRST